MSYDRRNIPHGVSFLVSEQAAMGAQFFIEGDRIAVYICGERVSAEHPLTVAVNDAKVREQVMSTLKVQS